MLVRRLRVKPAVLVNASAIGWYGERGDSALAEDSGPGEGFLSTLCRRWEEAAWAVTREGVRVCRLRIGLVLGRGGGVLQPMALATRLAGGTVLGDGRQWLSWIHLQDLLAVIDRALDDEDLHGAINAVAPQPLPQAAFARALAQALKRPLPWHFPAWLLRLLAGEMSELFLVSQRVEPRRLLAAGFRFSHAEASAALGEILATAPAQVARVYVNEQCTVCRTELGACQRADRRDVSSIGGSIEFRRIESLPQGLPEWSLRQRDLRRRLFVETTDGQMLSGLDAGIALWLGLPRRRVVARLAQLPGLHAVAETLYDMVIAPALSSWSEWRASRRTLPHAVQ